MAIENEEERSFVENIYYTYKQQMMNICVSILKNTDDAQDALSDTFERIISNLQHFMNAEHLEGLVLVTTKNVACHHYNRKKKKNENESSSTYYTENENGILLDFSDPNSNVDQALLDNEFINEVMQLLNTLPSDVSTIVVYKYLYHYSNTEIAEMLGIDRSKVNLKLHRARKKLQNLLNEQYPDQSI